MTISYKKIYMTLFILRYILRVDKKSPNVYILYKYNTLNHLARTRCIGVYCINNNYMLSIVVTYIFTNQIPIYVL